MIISGTYNLVVDPLWSQIPLQEVYLECDCSIAPVTINLFEISELGSFWNVKIFVSDISNSCATNNITINAGGSDIIGNTSVNSIVLNTNGCTTSLYVVNSAAWGTPFVSNEFPVKMNYGLYSQLISSVPITGTTVESSLVGTGLGTLTVPANGFKQGDSFTAKLGGLISCIGTATIHIRVKSGAIALADTGVITLDAATSKAWELEIDFTITEVGAATVAKILTNGQFVYTKNASFAFDGANFNVANTTTFDTTISNTLEVTAEWNTNNVGNSIHSDIFILNKIF